MIVLFESLIILAAGSVVAGAMYMFLHRLDAQLMSRGIIPDDYDACLVLVERARGAVSPAEAMAAIRRMPASLAETMSMREHMQVVDVHLLRAQDYVVALGADDADPALALLFRRLRLARKALRAVVEDQSS